MKPTILSVHLLLLLLLTVLSAAGVAGEFYAEERYDLILLRESLLSTLNLHSNWTGPPCYFKTSKWIGITCSDDSHVVGVALEGAHLTGLLPSTAFRNMRHLRVLNLRNNALRGPLPTLDGLVDLRYVSLSHNRFSGSIPAGFRRLPNLTWLEVQDNVLDGVIPALEQDLQVFNVSYNFLRGSVPSKLQRFPESSFYHNSELCGKPLSTPCSSTSPHLIPTGDQPVPSASNDPSSTEKSRNKALGAWSSIVLIFVAATMVSLVVVTMMFLLLGRNKGNSTRKRAQAQQGFKEGKNEEIEFLANNERWATFGIQELLRSPAELLGRGKVGETFRATLDTTGSMVRVKRLNKRICDLPKKEFAKQMHLHGRMKHQNLAEVVSFYYSVDEKLVISECVPGGSLFDHLHGSRGEGRVPLNWTTRLRIVKGVANGLDYMHHHQPFPSSKTAPHANLKSTNIMIPQSNQVTGHHFQAKLTDFGFLPLLSSRGMAGNLAVGKTPEFSQGQKLTCKADVFCLGLVLLEVVTGHYSGDRHDDLVVWVKSAVRAGRPRDVVDIEMVWERDALGEMAKLAEIALECLAPTPEKRPEMSELVKRIGEIRETTHA